MSPELWQPGGLIAMVFTGFAVAYGFMKKETQGAAQAVKAELEKEIDELRQEVRALRLRLDRSTRHMRKAQILAVQKGEQEIADECEKALNAVNTLGEIE